MLSYMLPVEEKPPSGSIKGHLQLNLGNAEPLSNGRTTSTPMSKDTSVSSFVSDATTATASSASDRGKPKLIINGGKHQTLKR